MEFRNIPIDFDFTELCKHISENKITVIVGKNGTGKSTLLKAVMGYYYAYMADKKYRLNNAVAAIINNEVKIDATAPITINTDHIPDSPYKKLVYPRIEKILDEGCPTWVDEFNAVAKVLKIQRPSALDKFDMAHYVHGPTAASELLAKQDALVSTQLFMTGYMDISSLSSGEQTQYQLDYIIRTAKATKTKKPLFVIDEIDSSVDIETVATIVGMINHMLTTSNGHVLMVTHHPFMMKVANKVLVLDEGKLTKMNADDYIYEKTMLKIS